MRRADYRKVAESKDTVWIEDLNLGNVSVTNDAEWVVEDVLQKHGNKRIAYKDSTGEWDELIHNGKNLTGFGPWKGTIPETL